MKTGVKTIMEKKVTNVQP